MDFDLCVRTGPALFLQFRTSYENGEKLRFAIVYDFLSNF